MSNLKPYTHILLKGNRRFCNGCKKAKALTSDFWFRSPNDASGFQAPCKLCRKVINADYYLRTSTAPKRQPRISKEEKRRRRTESRNLLKRNNPKKLQRIERGKSLQANYGITLNQYEELFKSQSKACAICKCRRKRHSRFWHVDHCHKSGLVRGILCASCNVMLGYAKEHPEILSRAITYLKKFNDNKMF